MELPIYTIKSSVLRILMPKLVKLVGLAILLYIGVYLNFKIVIGKTIPEYINYLIIGTIFILVMIEILLTYKQVLKNKYYFFTGRIEFRGKNPKTLDFRYFNNANVSKSFLDKILKTGTININPNFKLESVSNPDQVNTYIQQLAARIKQPQIQQTIR